MLLIEVSSTHLIYTITSSDSQKTTVRGPHLKIFCFRSLLSTPRLRPRSELNSSTIKLCWQFLI
jgi:SET domain-containing protein